MKQFWKLEKSQAVCDAAKSQQGLHIGLEILIFIAVYFVCTIGQMMIVAPVELMICLSNPDYMRAMMSGDLKELMEVSNRIAANEAYIICSLLSTAMMILLTLLFCKLIQKRKLNTVGFRKKGFVGEYISGLGVGFAIFSAAVLICVLTGSLKLEGLSATFAPGIFLLFVVGFMIQGMAEEVLCRGYFLVSVGRRYTMWVAVIANSVLFAALHLLNPGISVLAIVNLTLFGVFASVYFIKRNNIWGIGALHSVWNLAQGNIYGIRVSGLNISCSIFSSELTEGQEWMNGGAFGLEGGLAVTIVLVAATAVMLCMKGKMPENESTISE